MKDLFFNSKEILGKSRYPWVDYARGICIILVCYRHVYEGLGSTSVNLSEYPMFEYLNMFFFSFRMPLFFIVSGIFFMSGLQRKGMNDYIRQRFSTIFYPLIIWGSIQITLQLVFAVYVNADRRPIDYLYLLTDPRKIEQFWYLNALFFVSVLYTLVKVYGKFRPMQQLLLGIFLLGLAEIAFITHTNIGFLFDVFFFYFFFAIGDLLADFILNSRNYKMFTSKWLFLLIVPVFAVLQHYFTRINLQQDDDYYVQYHIPWLYTLCALAGGAFIINISFILQKMDVARFFRVIGYHSLYIYAIHLMVTSFTRTIMTHFLHISNVPLLLVAGIVMGIVVPIVFYNLAMRAGAYWLFSLRKRSSRQVGTSFYYKTGMVIPKESIQYEHKSNGNTDPENFKKD